MVIYPHPNAFRGGLAIETIRTHLCGFFEQRTVCVNAATLVDSTSGHTVCLGCNRITYESGLRTCDQCDREFIDLDNFRPDDHNEIICPECVERYGYGV